MTLNFSNHVPIYQQIGDHIRRSVAAGVYRSGESIPSVRALALELGVNPNTVQRAYEKLERDGLIESRKGLGMFVTENGAQTAHAGAVAAVRAAFTSGIRVGHAARLGDTRIRAEFESVWRVEGSGMEESS